jgi:hypothetical protein
VTGLGALICINLDTFHTEIMSVGIFLMDSPYVHKLLISYVT